MIAPTRPEHNGNIVPLLFTVKHKRFQSPVARGDPVNQGLTPNAGRMRDVRRRPTRFRLHWTYSAKVRNPVQASDRRWNESAFSAGLYNTREALHGRGIAQHPVDKFSNRSVAGRSPIFLSPRGVPPQRSRGRHFNRITHCNPTLSERAAK